ncbi:MAG: DUF3754 domain-containing protein [Candidatus Parabeggiatoa sp.]|nr:DUF3754 domain-containing protein [Candidatus Parabeggiatoa sp.]
MSDNLQTAEKSVEEPRERFIPIGRQEIVADLIADPHWTADQQKQFEEFCKIFTALYHYKFYAHLEELKHCYAPFNPDTDMVTQQDYTEEDKQKRRQTLVDEISQLLNNANYEELTIEAINDAMNAESYYGVRVSVDLDDFEKLIVYYRGSGIKVDYKRSWTSLFLVKKPIEIPIYKRLFLLLKLKTEQQRVDELVSLNGTDFEKKARKQVRNSRKNLPEDIIEEQVFLKLFKNIPRTDLEMLFPNQNVRLKLFDKIKLALSGGGGTIFGLFSIIGKIGAAVINPFALIGALIGLIGIIVRQILAIFTHRNKYMMVLSRNLYFLNLDNNFGVTSYLIDMAEEEEGKEAILAYYFLLTQSDKQYTQDELDRRIEKYLKDRYEVDVDFEVDDGLRKLRNEGILNDQDGKLKVLDLHQASACLDKQWDNFFNPDDKQ